MITILQWIRRSFGSQGERLGLAKESIKGLGAGAYLIDVLPSAVLSLGVLALFGSRLYPWADPIVNSPRPSRFPLALSPWPFFSDRGRSITAFKLGLTSRVQLAHAVERADRDGA
jgi:hypothetical protein